MKKKIRHVSRADVYRSATKQTRTYAMEFDGQFVSERMKCAGLNGANESICMGDGTFLIYRYTFDTSEINFFLLTNCIQFNERSANTHTHIHFELL